MPLEAFPAGFQQDVAAFEVRMRNPDPLDPEAPVRAFRPATLEGCRPWLLPGITGGPRSYSARRDAGSRPLRRHAGIEISPHLYRHFLAKTVAERRPELLHDVSRMLGHKSMRTTYSAYLGTEGPAASRRIAALLRAAKGKKEGEQG